MKKLLITYIFLTLSVASCYPSTPTTASYTPEILHIVFRQELSEHISQKDNALLFPQTKNTLRHIFNICPTILDSSRPEDAIKPDYVEIAHIVNMDLLSAFTAVHIIRWIDTHHTIQQQKVLQLPDPLPESIESDDDIKSNNSDNIECSIHGNEKLNAFLGHK